MAGGMKARSARGRYTEAGYVQPMYIADVPAGSRQDELRDFNRKGYAYRSDRPWRESPSPALDARAAAQPAQRRAASRMAWPDRLAACVRREKRDAALCAVLLVVLLTMGVLSANHVMTGAQIAQDIRRFQQDTAAFEAQNDGLRQQLELASSGERVRNLAQNRLNMLRPERAQTEVIYVQAADSGPATTLQQNEEPQMEMLDILLGLLNVLNIGE